MQLLIKFLSIFNKEPFILFTIPAILIFLLYAFTSSSNEYRIILTNEQIESYIENQENLLGYKFNPDQKEEAINRFINDEILYREAKRRGLDISDGKIHHRLINKMLFIYQVEVNEPTQSELEIFYTKNREYYIKPERISFEHSFFSTKPSNATSIINELKKTDETTKIGENFWLGNKLNKYSRKELEPIFGVDFTENILMLEPGNWYGPYSSNKGFHFVKVLEKESDEYIPMNKLGNTLKEDWFKTQSAKNIEKRIDELRNKYKIVYKN